MTFGRLDGTPVGAEVYEAPLVGGCDAVIRVDGSHMAVELSVPVGRMV